MREKSGGILSVFAIAAIGGAIIGLKWSGLDLNLDHFFCQGLGNCFEEFVKHVIPELQKRGIYRKEYTGATLRDHLGLKRPAIGDWRGNTDAAD